MAWTATKKMFGVCGNFKWEILNLTDVKATRSVVKPGFTTVYQAYSTNTSDNKDVLNAQTLAWTGTCDTNTPNELDDSSETFDPALYDLFAQDTTAASAVARVAINASDATRLLCYKPNRSAVYDAFPLGSETYTIYSERAVQLAAVTAGDEGTLLIIGR